MRHLAQGHLIGSSVPLSNTCGYFPKGKTHLSASSALEAHTSVCAAPQAAALPSPSVTPRPPAPATHHSPSVRHCDGHRSSPLPSTHLSLHHIHLRIVPIHHLPLPLTSLLQPLECRGHGGRVSMSTVLATVISPTCAIVTHSNCPVDVYRMNRVFMWCWGIKRPVL